MSKTIIPVPGKTLSGFAGWCMLILCMTASVYAAENSQNIVIEVGNTKLDLVLGDKSNPTLGNIAGILKRQILQRCDAKLQPDKASQSHLTVELSIQADIETEGFRIEDGKAGKIRILGGEAGGVLYGVGKFLRTARYDRNGLTPGRWRGVSVPKCPLRAIYLATHFNNFYEAAPIEEIEHYIEDLGLWGYNTIFVHYPTWQFDGLHSPESRKWIKRFKTVLAHAKKCGLHVGLLQVPNQGYKTAPLTVRGVRVPGHTRGNHGVNLCASKPEAQKLLMQLLDGLLDEFKNVGLDYFEFWPYDEGGCSCEQCWPWGARGYTQISRDWTRRIQKKFPHCKIVLSTWCFENENDENPDGEWVGLTKFLKQDKSWVDYIMADGHGDYFPKYLLAHGVPAQLPLVNFPEISMFGMMPWGGFGANPAPQHFQMLWDRIKHIAHGGAPYSEGRYEDLNKAIIAGFYWDPNRKATDTVTEYLAFEFSPDVIDDMLKVVGIFEQNHYRNIQNSALLAFDLVTKAQTKLTENVKNCWRWRIFYLRALIDKEMFESKGKLEGKTLKAAFDELTQLYYAENSHSMPIKPPQLK
ncbi:MAG: hypothetical protein JXD22_09740 [Sedimentisphaerales bacterium]|nr:hypothetical protein [Sedimentisphaerales bacterium]